MLKSFWTSCSRCWQHQPKVGVLKARLGTKRFRGRVVRIVLAIALSSSGCAIHYFDEDTGVEHVWGFGHMKMKVAAPNEGLQAILHGTDSFGLGIGKAHKHGYLTLGWHRLEFIDIHRESTSIRFEWPDSSFARVRVGSEFPKQYIDEALRNEALRNEAQDAEPASEGGVEPDDSEATMSDTSEPAPDGTE